MFLTCKTIEEAKTKGMKVGENVSFVNMPHVSSEPYLISIGDNTIIGANSLVNKDIPDNVVAAGNPCKVICTLDEYRRKHSDDFLYMVSLPPEEKKQYLLKKFNIE